MTIPAGAHTVVWQYIKDSTVSRGADCGWVDFVLYSINLSVALDSPGQLLPPGGQGMDRRNLNFFLWWQRRSESAYRGQPVIVAANHSQRTLYGFLLLESIIGTGL